MSHTENFPRKAFETACHAMGVLEQNREYLQFHLKNADEKTQQALADMQRGAARLERAMSEMEDLLALQDPPPARRWMDLRDVLAQADAMGPEIARALGLTLTVAQPGPETLCTVLGCPDSAEKICFHLLSNALRASDAGGTVALTLEAGREGWTLTVADRGCGLPQEANRQENRRRFVGGAGASCAGGCAPSWAGRWPWSRTPAAARWPGCRSRQKKTRKPPCPAGWSFAHRANEKTPACAGC